MDVKMIVMGQSLFAAGPVTLAADSIEFINFDFDFSEDWADCVKVAQFTQGETTYNRVLTYDNGLLPAEIQDGEFSVSVFGTVPGESVRGTTTVVYFKIERSGQVADGETPIPPTPDLYDQLLEKIGEPAIAKAVEEYLTEHPPEKGENGLSMFRCALNPTGDLIGSTRDRIDSGGREVQLNDLLLMDNGRVYGISYLLDAAFDAKYTGVDLKGPQGDTGPKGDTGPQGDVGPAGKDGAPGTAGADGFSPTIDVSKSGDTTTLTITDKNGVKTAEIKDGSGADFSDETAVEALIEVDMLPTITTASGAILTDINETVILRY